MYAVIQKWGNSHGIRLSKAILEASNIHANEKIEILTEKNCIIIKKAEKGHLTIKERLADYVCTYKADEWDTGKPEGNEVL